MKLTIDLQLLPEAHADPEPDGWTRGHVMAVLRAAGYQAELVRYPQPVVNPVGNPDDDSWGLGPGAAVALAEARAAFENTLAEPERHHCPMAGCTYSHTDRRGVGTHLRNHTMVECPSCGQPRKAGGLAAHLRGCKGQVLPEATAPPPMLAVRTDAGMRIDHVPKGVTVEVNGTPTDLPADLTPGDQLRVVTDGQAWVSVPIERTPFDPDEVRRRAADAI